MSDPITRLNAALEGRYRIERELGEGGMATVYLADDLKHERKVALKVLKPELAAVVGAERFLAEIKTTANLQHPHILPLFDSGEADTFLFYVMPYVEGESLRERLDREKQLPINEAVQIAGSVAQALGYAHRQGVIHRDIKPANILLHDGQPLISDFGIALALGAGAAHRLTETGLSLGTPHYMSPEQATGEENIGPAADTYALGCVLYEMLVGEPPYTGSTPQAILGKIIAADLAYPSSQRPSVPPNVDATVRRALEKIAADRFSTAHEFSSALSDPGFRTGEREAAAATAGGPFWNRLSAATTGAALVLAVLAAWAWLRPGPNRPAGASYAMDLALPADQLLAIPTARAYPFDISPDGRTLVYAGIREGVTRLYVRRLDSFDFVEIEGTEAARQPFFSWDGSQIGFFARGRLMRVPTDGGAPIFVADAPGFPVGATWGPDDILFARAGNLFRVPPSGGEPRQLELEGIGPNSRNLLAGATWPSHLPDGEHILVSASGVGDSTFVFGSASGELVAAPGPHLLIIDLVSGEVASRVTTGTQGQYVPTGHVLFFGGGGSVRAIPFDARSRRATGDPSPLIDDVFRGAAGGAAFFRASRSGAVVYVRGGYERSLALVDRNGRETLITLERRGFRLPHFSPDGSQVAVGMDDAGSNLWRYDVATGRGIALSGGGVNSRFHPDGRLFAGSGSFAERRPEPGPAPIIVWPDPPTWSSSWSRDGATVIVQSFGTETGYDIHALSLGDTALAPVLVTPADEDEGKLSPDGRWLVYESDRTGQDEIYLAEYPEMSGTQQVSVGGGKSPLWSHDGSEIFYRSGDRVMAVSVSTEASVTLGAPEVLFRAQYDHSQNLNWDVDPDGRFVMIRPDPGSFRQFRVRTDISSELEAR